jgi:hypothetical protein
MTLQSASQAEDELRRVAQQLTQWRQRRTTPRGRIPQPLWTQAVALTHVLPLSRVAKQLGLCPQRLRKRGGGKAVAAGVPTPALAPSFVELTPVWRSPTAEVEVQRADGTRLRISYHEASPPLALLLQTFLERS